MPKIEEAHAEINFDVKNDYDNWDHFEVAGKQQPMFAGKIFSPEASEVISLVHRASVGFANGREILLVGNPRGKIGVSLEFGGKGGPQGRLYAEGSVGNSRGRLKGKAQVDDQGKGKVKAEVEPNKKPKKEKK